MSKNNATAAGQYRSKYGYFSEDGREYICTRPDTPRPWYNYLNNPSYVVRFSQTGGGCSRYLPPDGNLINTPGSYDRPGKYIYIRDNDAGNFWSANWMPVQAEYESFRCVHGLDYSEIDSVSFGIRSRFHIFVPKKEPMEIWTLTLENTTGRKRRLSFFPFMELCLAGYMMAYDLPIYCSWTEYLADEKLLLGSYDSIHTGERFEYFIYPAFEIDGYDSRRADFIGQYNSYANPQNVIGNRCDNHDGYHDPLIAAFRKEVELEAGQVKTFHLLAGVSLSPEKRRETVAFYSDPDNIANALVEVKNSWSEKIRAFQVHTPDNAVNLYANIWLKNAVDKCVTSVRGPVSNSNYGYRDVMQDAKGIVKFAPQRTKEAILKAMPYQYSDGSALRQWASNPAYHDLRRFADSSLWITFTVCAYIRETGDVGILEIEKAHLDKGRDTVYEHMLAGLRKISNDIGAHNIPLVHEGDWMDGIGMMGQKGKGESVWLAMAVIAANKEAVELAEFIGDEKVVEELNAYNEKLAAAVNDFGWDGEWYRRGFTDEGRVVGTAGDDEVTLWLLPQLWAILSDVADDERVEKIRKVVEERLKTEMGYILWDPPFKRFRPDVGYMSLIIPKKWYYSHPNAFKFAAECYAGFGDSGYETLSPMLPLNHDPDKTHSEPYTIPNYYVVQDAERMGRSLFGWFTATCSWVFTTVFEGMLGIQPGYTGLCIDPCLPSDWKDASAEVTIRGARYTIKINNPEEKEKGVPKMMVDSKEIQGNCIPYFTDNKVHKIEVWL